MADLTTTFRDIIKRRQRQVSLINDIKEEQGDMNKEVQDKLKASRSQQMRQFSVEAQSIVSSIMEMKKLLKKNSVAYLNVNRHVQLEGSVTMSEADRDDMERQFSQFMRTCSERISILENDTRRVMVESGVGETGDYQVHFQSIITYLRNKLSDASEILKKYQEIRFKTLLDKTEDFAGAPVAATLETENKRPHQIQTGSMSSLPPEYSPVEEPEPQVSMQEKVLLEKENKFLFEHLNGLATELRKAEQSILEISSLQDQLEMHVNAQYQDINRLHDESIQTTDKVLRGNEILRRATRSGVEYRNFMLLFFLLLAFILWFLHWYE